MRRMCFIHLNKVPAVDYVHFECDRWCRSPDTYMDIARKWNDGAHHPLSCRIEISLGSFESEKRFLLFGVV